MLVQVQPSHPVKGNSDQQHDAGGGESGDDGCYPCYRGTHDQGQTHTVERTEHTPRIGHQTP